LRSKLALADIIPFELFEVHNGIVRSNWLVQLLQWKLLTVLKSMLTSNSLRQMVPAVDRLAAVTGKAELLSEFSDSLLWSDATAAEPFLSASEMGLTACWTATLGENCLDCGRFCGDLALIVAGALTIGVIPCTATLLSQWSHQNSVQSAAWQIDCK